VFAFHVPSNCKTPVKAVSIAVCICAPVAKFVELPVTEAVTTSTTAEFPPVTDTLLVVPLTLVTVPVFDVLLLKVVKLPLV
tara:strand:- start:843 stop:1085 length:243 start_codon:yes stop_codon:yes gene_type:complete